MKKHTGPLSRNRRRGKRPARPGPSFCRWTRCIGCINLNLAGAGAIRSIRRSGRRLAGGNGSIFWEDTIPAEHSRIHLPGEVTGDATRVVDCLDLVVTAHQKAPQLVVVADTASSFTASLVTAWLDRHPQVPFTSLPAYAPTVNLRERVGKFVNEQLVKNTDYEQYKTFRAHVFRFLNPVEAYVADLTTRRVEKFESIRVKLGELFRIAMFMPNQYLNWSIIVRFFCYQRQRNRTSVLIKLPQHIKHN